MLAICHKMLTHSICCNHAMCVHLLCISVADNYLLFRHLLQAQFSDCCWALSDHFEEPCKILLLGYVEPCKHGVVITLVPLLLIFAEWNHSWWLSISGVNGVGLECSASSCQNIFIVHCVQAKNKNAAVRGVFWRWLDMIVPLVTVDVQRLFYTAPATVVATMSP